MSRTKQPLGVYLHIPFCARKCAYCDFLSAPASAETMERYVERLKEEIRAAAEGLREHYRVATVFFGGGTPSILPGRLLCGVLEELCRQLPVEADAEITVECNPGTLTEEKLSAYRAAGVNRLSIGLQSADDRELKTLGRIHTLEEFLKNFELARRKGFRNLNVDLMSALPGQTRPFRGRPGRAGFRRFPGWQSLGRSISPPTALSSRRERPFTSSTGRARPDIPCFRTRIQTG